MRLKRFIPFGPFAPDRSRRDVGTLRKAENVLPIFGSYAVLPKLQSESSSDIGGDISGAHVHFYTVAAGNQFGYPIANAGNVDGNWVALPDEDDELYEQVDNLGVDDSSRVFVAGNVDDAAARTALLKCSALDAPAITTGDRELKFRYRVRNHAGSQWTIQATVTDTGSLNIVTTVTGTTDSDWEEHTLALDTTTLDDVVSDWDAIWFQIVATVPGNGTQTFYPAQDRSNSGLWEREDGSATALFQSLDDDAPLDDTYIVTPPIEPGDETYVELLWPGTGAGQLNNDSDPHVHDIDGAGNSGHSLTWRWKASTSDVLGAVRLMEYGKATPIAEKTGVSVPTSYTEDSIALTTTEAGNIDDYTQLYTRIRFYNETGDQSASDLAAVYPYKDASIQGGNVDPKPWYSVVVNDGNYVTLSVPPAGQGALFGVTWKALDDRGTYEGWKFIIEAKAATGTGHVHGQISLPGTSLDDVRFENKSLGTSYGKATLNLTEAQAEELVNATAELRIFCWNFGFQTLHVKQMYVETPASRTGFLSHLKFEIPDHASAEVSQLQLTIPTQYSYRVGDKTEIYAGVPAKLYQVHDGSSHTWADVSRASGPPAYDNVASNDEHAQSWDFCSWGEDILATNFIDPVQIKEPALTTFANLIPAEKTEKPQGKFIGVVSDFVVLGNISALGVTSPGQPDEVWWSAQNNVLDWDPSPVTQCDRQRLVPTPGEITGMVGGEFGIIFKATSIYRMNYIGSPLIFSFDLLSRSAGTVHPKSIVAVDDDVYFYGQGGLYVIESGERVTPLDQGAVNRILQDREFEGDSVREFVHTDVREANSYVIGAYDPVSRLIYWSIRRKDAPGSALGTSDEYAHRNDYMLVYSPVENRFATIRDETSMRVAYIGVLPNNASGQRIDRNVFVINMGTDAAPTNTVAQYATFSSTEERYPATFRTNVIAATALMGEDKTGTNISIRRIRPIFWEQPEEDATKRVDITITLRVSDDPLMHVRQEDSVYVNNSVDDRDEDGWFPVKLMAGEFFDVEVSLVAETGDGVREILGFEIDYEPHGEY